MEMKCKGIIFSAVFYVASCAEITFKNTGITDVYVTDFNSDDIAKCRPSDVDLTHDEAREFFLRARQVDYKVIHDHYNFAPCYIEGTLNFKSKSCDWVIRAGATGHISCGKGETYFVCDICEDLFE